jgi:vitamin B12 transporter
MKYKLILVAVTSFAPAIAGAAEDTGEIAEIKVSAARVANTRPAGTYASVATALRFDPLTELQSRGLPEGQADVTVRGGLFENTGFRAGAVTIMDPQTGHYVAGLPIDPAFLSDPELLVGIDNSLAGFNSSIATVDYALRRITDSGSLDVGAGSDNLRFLSLRAGGTSALTSGADIGYAMSASRSSGDGTIGFGDHDFSRFNVHLQRTDDGEQTDVVIGYEDKFYGWPGAYTGFASLPETDDTKTKLLLANHRLERDAGYLEFGAFYRELEDDYDFDRSTSESGGPGSFDHETKVFGLGFQGSHEAGNLDWQFAAQLASDELVFSTDLTEGEFDSRDYATFSVVPTMEIGVGNAKTFIVQFGATVDWTSEDGSAVSPVGKLTWHETTARGSDFASLEYSSSSQVPGYTVLNSPPAGLFGGNASLGREKSRQLALSTGRDAGNWDSKATVFYRQDDDLVDWTFATGAPFARQANAVDIDVLGAEFFFRRHWDSVELVTSYTYLDKDSDYGDAVVDASFYALNYAKHRATFALRYRFAEGFELRWDNEYRQQSDNPLRDGDDTALLSSLAVAWQPARSSGLSLVLTADNLTDDEYQQFPGTPAVGRQVSLSASYEW